jgi:hypothetical protein
MTDDMGIKYYVKYELDDHVFTPGIRVKYKTDNVTGYNRDFAFSGWGTPSVPDIKSGFIRSIIKDSGNIYADVMPNPTALNRAIRVRLDLLEPMDENLPPVGGGGINLKRNKSKKSKRKKSKRKKSKKKKIKKEKIKKNK